MESSDMSTDQNTIVIGLAGPARSGKNTAAGYIEESLWWECSFKGDTFPNFCEQYSFAQPIRDAMYTLFGWGPDVLESGRKDQVDPEFGFSPREAMQKMGTEYGRSLSPSLWLDMAKHRLGQTQFLIITDVRFQNEADWVREHGVLLHMFTGDRPIPRSVNGAHVSEQGVVQKPFDSTVINGGDEVELEDNIYALVVDLVDTWRDQGYVI